MIPAAAERAVLDLFSDRILTRRGARVPQQTKSAANISYY